ncbi:hypothetical protein LIER_38592 [Lithospermum erythrorhizon]|uniref:Gag-pol polyprotein n=1 Tax=Lithospermum erythrorhizon TaxID=34254 RepID=A0AAV3Q4N6_LITER
MEEDESIASYNNNIKDIANESSSIGVTMSNDKLMRNILSTIPEKFAYKVTALEQAQDLTVMRLDELIDKY